MTQLSCVSRGDVAPLDIDDRKLGIGSDVTALNRLRAPTGCAASALTFRVRVQAGKLGSISRSRMPDESFDVALRDALSRVPSSTGDNLMGFQIDMEAYMEDSVVPFRDVVVRRTGDPTKLLVATCTCEHLEAAIIKDALSHVWQEQLRYNFWEQHEFVSNDREVRLRFVTTTGRNEGLCVTGEIVVTIDS